MQILVFSDLDGTLMEHESYSIEPALDALGELQRREIPLILNSSKTRPEIEVVQQILDLHSPFVCENGGALHLHELFPGEPRLVEFGRPRSEWLEQVQQLRTEFGYQFEGFSNWSDREAAEHTGLSLEQARLALRREYSEPITWRDSDEHRMEFLQQLKKLDLQLLEGGRFLSIQSGYNKANAVNWLQQKYQQQGETLTIALGDSPNDQAMLERADLAVVVRSIKSAQVQLVNPGQVIYTDKHGPAGWQDAVSDILNKLDSGALGQKQED